MFRFRDNEMFCNSQQYYTFSIWDEEEFFLQAVHTGDVFVYLLANPKNGWGLVFFNFKMSSIEAIKDEISFGAHHH